MGQRTVFPPTTGTKCVTYSFYPSPQYMEAYNIQPNIHSRIQMNNYTLQSV